MKSQLGDALRYQTGNIPAGSGLHHHLAITLAKRVRKMGLIAGRQDIVEIWLATEFIYPL